MQMMAPVKAKIQHKNQEAQEMSFAAAVMLHCVQIQHWLTGVNASLHSQMNDPEDTKRPNWQTEKKFMLGDSSFESRGQVLDDEKHTVDSQSNFHCTQRKAKIDRMFVSNILFASNAAIRELCVKAFFVKAFLMVTASISQCKQ